VTRYWHGYLSGVSNKAFAYGPADASATPSDWLNLSGAVYPGCLGKEAVKLVSVCLFIITAVDTCFFQFKQVYTSCLAETGFCQ